MGVEKKNRLRKVLKDSVERWLFSRRNLEDSKEIQLGDVYAIYGKHGAPIKLLDWQAQGNFGHLTTKFRTHY